MRNFLATNPEGQMLIVRAEWWEDAWRLARSRLGADAKLCPASDDAGADVEIRVGRKEVRARVGNDWGLWEGMA